MCRPAAYHTYCTFNESGFFFHFSLHLCYFYSFLTFVIIPYFPLTATVSNSHTHCCEVKLCCLLQTVQTVLPNKTNMTMKKITTALWWITFREFSANWFLHKIQNITELYSILKEKQTVACSFKASPTLFLSESFKNLIMQCVKIQHERFKLLTAISLCSLS